MGGAWHRFQQPRPTFCSAPACGSLGHAPHLSRLPSPYPTKQAKNTHLQPKLGGTCPCPGIGPHTEVLGKKKVNSDPLYLSVRDGQTRHASEQILPKACWPLPRVPLRPYYFRSLTPCLRFPDGFPEERKQLTGADLMQRAVFLLIMRVGTPTVLGLEEKEGAEKNLAFSTFSSFPPFP